MRRGFGVVGPGLQTLGVDMFWDVSPYSEGDGDWARNTGGKARDQPQPPILPCPGIGDLRVGVHAGKGEGEDTSK